MATHSSVLAWRIPGMGEPGGLPSLGSHRVGHNWSDLAVAQIFLVAQTIKNLQCRRPRFNLGVGKILWRREWQSTPFSTGESHGQRNLAGYSPWGCEESATSEQLTLLLQQNIFSLFLMFYLVPMWRRRGNGERADELGGEVGVEIMLGETKAKIRLQCLENGEEIIAFAVSHIETLKIKSLYANFYLCVCVDWNINRKKKITCIIFKVFPAFSVTSLSTIF